MLLKAPKLAGAIANDARERERDPIGRGFGSGKETQVGTSKMDGSRILAGVVIGDGAGNGGLAGTATAVARIQVAVQTVLDVSRYADEDGQGGQSGREEVEDGERSGIWIVGGDIENQAIGKDTAGVANRYQSISESGWVEGPFGEAMRTIPEGADRKMEGIFEETGLSLEMVLG